MRLLIAVASTCLVALLISIKRGAFRPDPLLRHGRVESPSARLPEAFVYIAVGSGLHGGHVISQLTSSLCSLRHIGGWRGRVIVATDDLQAVSPLMETFGVEALLLPEMPHDAHQKTDVKIYALKCQLHDLLPPSHQNSSFIYMDSDILVTRPLDEFLASLPQRSVRNGLGRATGLEFEDGILGSFSEITTRTGRHDADAAFRCHGGVIWWQGGPSDSCLRGWCSLIEEGFKHGAHSEEGRWLGDDQYALSEALRERVCKVTFFPDHHMKFMRDARALLLKPRATFSHYTHTVRRVLLKNSFDGWFYRLWSIDLNVPAVCRPAAYDAYVYAS